MAISDDPGALIRLVADPIRLALLGRAAEGTVSLEDVAAHLDVPKRRVADALGKLRAAGLIDDELSLRAEELRAAVTSLPTAESAAATITEGPWTDDEKMVLRRFFSGTRLTEIPTSRSKRTLVLERLAQEFEPGLRYRERDINFTIQLFHQDYASIRRYMIEEDIMTRADGVYWRTGGRYVAGSVPD